jgi:hypothetical protein
MHRPDKHGSICAYLALAFLVAGVLATAVALAGMFTDIKDGWRIGKIGVFLAIGLNAVVIVFGCCGSRCVQGRLALVCAIPLMIVALLLFGLSLIGGLGM